MTNEIRGAARLPDRLAPPQAATRSPSCLRYATRIQGRRPPARRPPLSRSPAPKRPDQLRGQARRNLVGDSEDLRLPPFRHVERAEEEVDPWKESGEVA